MPGLRTRRSYVSASSDVAFHPPEGVGLSMSRISGLIPHGLLTRCLRFVATVARLLLYDHARLASGWRPCLGRTGALLPKRVPS